MRRGPRRRWVAWRVQTLINRLMYHEFPLHRITQVGFGLVTSDHVLKRSVVEVTETTLYDGTRPKHNGPNDLRLGTTERVRCATCMHDMRGCIGHTGHVTLARPQYHIGFTDIVLKVLRSVCFFCSRLLVPPVAATADARPKAVLAMLATRGKACTTCVHCSGYQPAYSRCGASIEMVFPDDAVFDSEDERAFATRPFTALEAYNIMHHITDTDCEALGMNPTWSRPEHMVMRHFLVPPTCIRPSVTVSDASRSRGQDDLTLKIQDIVKCNTALGAAQTDADVRKHEELLQLHMALYFDKDNRSQVGNRGRAIHRTGPCRSLGQRLRGKKGRVRGNLMGKRVDYSARSVIGPDANLDLDEIGVPECITRSQTYPERVTSFNLAYMRRLVVAGPTAVDGADRILLPDGCLVTLSMVADRTKLALPVGTVVYRHLRDGDWVVMNRQPSLHKESMMAHRVRRVRGTKTLLLPVLDTTPYNADFDGDEMNLHTPQTDSARAECLEILSVTNNILSPQASRPCISAIQDTLLGSWLLTARDTFIPEHRFMNYSMRVRYGRTGQLPLPAILKPRRMYTGSQLMSWLLPAQLVVRRGAPGGDDDACIWVHRGELMCGRMHKKTLGTSQGATACASGVPPPRRAYGEERPPD